MGWAEVKSLLGQQQTKDAATPAEVSIASEIKQEHPTTQHPISEDNAFFKDGDKMAILDPSIIPEGDGMMDG